MIKVPKQWFPKGSTINEIPNANPPIVKSNCAERKLDKQRIAYPAPWILPVEAKVPINVPAKNITLSKVPDITAPGKKEILWKISPLYRPRLSYKESAKSVCEPKRHSLF